jgi:hypothetical protein
VKRVFVTSTVLLVFSCSMAAQKIGIKPKAKVSEYSAVQKTSSFELGATQLSARQVRKAFVTNLSKDYLVVEVGVFPNSKVELSPEKFALKEKHSDNTIHVADPQDMAATIYEKDQKRKDVEVIPLASVSYSTGSSTDPNYQDPNLDRRRGWSTNTGVGVAVNDNKKDPKTSEADRKTMLAELKEKSFPQTKTKEAVAGYLYFPTKLSPGVAYELVYQDAGQTLTMPLVAPAK